MRADGGPTAIRVSCSLDMNDLQSHGFDFVPKSDYNEKWHLENKCLFHNQQSSDEKRYKMENSHAIGHATRNLGSRSKNKIKLGTDENSSYERSGDWKYNDKLIEGRLSGKVAPEFGDSNCRWKNLYGVSSCDRSNRWNQNSVDSNVLRNIYKRVDLRYKDPDKSESKPNMLNNFRESLVNYQESCGIPRTEYSFPALVKMMGQVTGRSLLALFYVMLNIIPLAEVFLYILRFVLDKVISIRSSKDFRQTSVRSLVFATELFSVYICLIFIFGFIVFPIVRMVIGIIGKIMLYS